MVEISTVNVWWYTAEKVHRYLTACPYFVKVSRILESGSKLGNVRKAMAMRLIILENVIGGSAS